MSSVWLPALAVLLLLGAVGGPKWDDPNAKTRPEAGLLKIRKELGWKPVFDCENGMAQTVQWLVDVERIKQVPQRYAHGLDTRNFNESRKPNIDGNGASILHKLNSQTTPIGSPLFQSG